MAPEELYGVEKMRYADDEKTVVVYNDHITISNIPERVHDYRLGARSALDWVLETNRVRADKKSGITNDPNDWAIEHEDPTYIFDLVGRIVTVSMRTRDTIDQLPQLVLISRRPGACQTGEYLANGSGALLAETTEGYSARGDGNRDSYLSRPHVSDSGGG